MPRRHFPSRTLQICLTTLLMLGGGSKLANAQDDSDFDVCGLLSAAEWDKLVGKLYYGPEAKHFKSESGAVNARCTANLAEVWVRRPAGIKNAAELGSKLKGDLDALAAEDEENGITWSVEVTPAEGLSQPAVSGLIVAQSGEVEGTEVYYIAALAGDALIQVKSANSAEEALGVAKAVLAKVD